MGNIIPFSFEGHGVRTIVDESGQRWFVAKDVCRVLEISKHRDAMARLDEDERDARTVDTPAGPQEMTTINESGLYSLILTSRKPAAKRLKKWVISEILPSIRKTGSYGVDTATYINDPARLRRDLMRYVEGSVFPEHQTNDHHIVKGE